MMTVLAALCAGAVAWTLTEYLVHRFDGHGFRVLIPNHVRHHADPVNAEVLHVPIWTLIGVAAAWTLLGGAVAGFTHGLAFGGGFVVTYRYYEWLHDRLHDTAPRTAYGRWARRHHFYHHFQSPKVNHGVTTPVWDVVFGTYQPVKTRIRVPKRMAMPWLLDGAGDVLPVHTAGYFLR